MESPGDCKVLTSEALMNYMPTAVPIHKQWDLAFVGAKLEAFAIASCDIVSKCTLSFPSKIAVLYSPWVIPYGLHGVHMD